MSEPYRPIACGLHDILEDRIVRRRACRVEWTAESGETCVFNGRLLDIAVQGGEEGLVLEDGRRVRLDRLRRVDETEF